MLRTRFAWLWVVTLLVVPAQTMALPQVGDCSAAKAPLSRATAVASLSLAYQQDCLGGANDTGELTIGLQKTLPRNFEKKSLAEVRLLVLAAIDPLVTSATEEQSRITDDVLHIEVFKVLAQALSSVRRAVEGSTAPTSDPVLLPGGWQWLGPQGEFRQIRAPVAAMVRAACGWDGPTCETAYLSAAQALRLARLTERALTFYSTPVLAENATLVTGRDARWTKYFDDTLPQFPWELALNSSLFAHRARAKAGFAMPPSSQWIVVHPLVGLEYVSAAPRGNRFEPAVMVEALGINRWWWNPSDEPAHAIGASAVVVLSDRAGLDSLGYGFLVRYAHRYAVAITIRSGKTGLMITSDLGQWIARAGQKAKDKMKASGGEQ